MKFFLLTTLSVLLFSYASIAEDLNTPRYTLPEATTTVTNGVEYKCLDLPAWKNVILIASEYQRMYDWRLKISGALDSHNSMVQMYETALINKDAQITLLANDREYLELRLNQEVSSKATLLKREKLETGLLWAVIAIETVIIGVVGIKGAVD